MTIGKPLYVEINGIDLTSAVADIDFGGNAYLDELPKASWTFGGYWDAGLGTAEMSFSYRLCHLTAQSRCWWLKVLDPKRYARLRRMRHETRRRRRRG